MIVCLLLWAAFVIVMSATEGLLSKSEYIVLAVVTPAIAVASFLLSLLGGYILKKNKGAIRLGIVFSVVHFLSLFVVLEPHNKSWHWQEFVGLAVIPLILFWGLIWIISGFLSENNSAET